jgi:biotin carboxylase
MPTWEEPIVSRKNVLVFGLTDLQRGELETVRGAEGYRFHGVLDYERLVADSDMDFEVLLEDARRELAAFDGRVDALVAHWDFPTSVLVPVLAGELGIPAPSLESLVKSEHKYWSRLEQKASVPECVPGFCAFDPFAEDPLAQVELDFPFWVKPVKAHSSSLGFEIHDEQQFRDAVEQIRAEVGNMGDAFQQVLKRLELPPEIESATGTSCLAEQLISGTQAAPEGTMFRGEFNVHGVFDMYKDDAGTSFERLDYPADSVPESVQQRMIDVSERYLRHVGFDDGCFNAEFMWDRSSDKVWLVEVNTRISQSHSDLFAKVDGASNHEVAIDIALGRRPSMPHREGPFAVASQCMIFHDEDAVVAKVPTEQELAEIAERFPETEVTLSVQAGDRLSGTPNQDSYRYIVAKAYIGAQTREELVRKHRAVAEALPFEFESVEGTA